MLWSPVLVISTLFLKNLTLSVILADGSKHPLASAAVARGDESLSEV